MNATTRDNPLDSPSLQALTHSFSWSLSRFTSYRYSSSPTPPSKCSLQPGQHSIESGTPNPIDYSAKTNSRDPLWAACQPHNTTHKNNTVSKAHTKVVSKHLDASVLFLHRAEPVHLKRMKRDKVKKQKVPFTSSSNLLLPLQGSSIQKRE